MEYKSSGVDIDAGNRAVELIKESVKTTHSSQVLSNIGGFAAGFSFPVNDYKEPILVSSTDGVGTKLLCAIQEDKLDTIGIDCVAMCVNDLICMGATPLFFLDYIACHKLVPEKMKTIIDGIVEGCKQSGCALIGGEMAEMNQLYKTNDFDVAGFCVGVVEKSEIIDGSAIKEGDFVYALSSSGIHSNGFSLVRKIIRDTPIGSEVSISEFLEPTKIYVEAIKQLKEKYTINGIANITGGGLIENCERVLPNNVDVTIHKNKIRGQRIFSKLKDYGSVSEEEMYRVFNMGVGMVVISSDQLEENEDCYQIGTVGSGAGAVHLV